jgi:hypothetical protein
MMLEFMPHRAAKIVRARAARRRSSAQCVKALSWRRATLPSGVDARATCPRPQVQDTIMSCASNAKETHGMKKSKLFISETYADQARRPRFEAGLLRNAQRVVLTRAPLSRGAGPVLEAVPAARAGARVPDPQAHLLHSRQDEEPRD